ncbi:unnamed protein product [Lactuca saligna]|uniref:JmjC domain-containing protein n=1 Tax=Lactuca saligna TaxID=75948 RepID=A0AA35V6F4_LACSI|nr:unnamed protein product [Lactuca saligna]
MAHISTWQLQRKLVPAEMEEPKLDPIKNSRKRRKTEKSASTKVGNGADKQLKSCHQCHRSERDHVVEYPKISEEEFIKACPFCRKNCNCKACLRGYSPKVMQGYSCSKPDKIQYSEHIIQKVLAFVKRLNADQLGEKLIEAKVKGLSLSYLQLQDAECEVLELIFLFNDKCGAYIFDLYRSCECGNDLCLVCCQDLREGNMGMKSGWKFSIDGSINCPPIYIGGCNEGILELKRIMPVDWVVNMLEKAQEIYKINTSDDIDIHQTSTKCGMCCYDFEANEENSNGYYLYSLSAKDIQPQQDMQHFQLHWSKGEPIVVNDVLSTSSGLSWEPMVLWRAFRDITKNNNRSHTCEVNAIDCFDWKKVSVDLHKFFRGYSEGGFKKEILKLEDWQPSCLSEGEWLRYFVEFISCLPFKDYTHPKTGYLNVAVKLPDLSSKPDMSPRMDIAYGNSVTKLHYDKSDTVNVLTHTGSHILASTKLNNTKMVKHQDEALVCEEEGALWDIFRRQDIVHPIHDWIFYLNIEHKRKLKEELGIEPWSFKQKLGDAVFIPAVSSTKIELNFVSPESLGECIRLQHEFRMLPNNHRTKQNKLNIGKMMLYALDHAMMDLAGFSDSNNPIYDLKVHETSNASRKLMPDEGLCRGNVVGTEVKKLLEAVEHQYPDTFQGVQIRAKEMWISILREFHVVIKSFLETSVGELAEDRFGRILNLREPLKERLCGRWKQFVEAQEMLKVAQLEYDNASDALKKKAREVAHKFGDEYDQVLKGHLGFGILQGY